MFAFFLVVTLILPHHRIIHFYHTSHARFGYADQCQKRGIEVGNALLTKLSHLKKRANVQAHVECEQQVTNEA